MNLPSFMVIGAMKSATSSICDLLNRHPGVFICDPKEPEYFCRSEDESDDLREYTAIFRQAIGGQLVGEGSTSYTKSHAFPGVAERIARHLPKTRLIYIMRDPIRRIESHWLHTLRTGNNPGDLNTIADANNHHYVETSLYSKQIDQYRLLFPAEQILYLFYEDFRNNSTEVMKQVFDFIGVDRTHVDSTAATPRHVSVGSIVDRPILAEMQRRPVIRRAFRLLPTALREVAKRPFQMKVMNRPQWNRSSLEKIIRAVEQDSRSMLEYCGKPIDFWPLSAEEYLRAQ